MRVHVAEKVEDVDESNKDGAQVGPTEEAPAKERRAPVPRFRSSWTGGTVLWNSEKTSAPAAGQAVWQWEHRTGFKNYDARATARIEDAFQRGLSRVRLKAGKMDDTPMELFFHDMIQFDPKTGNTRKIRRVGRDSCWKKLRRKANELAWLIETGRTQRVVFAQYEKKRKELHRSMDRRDYHVNDLYKDSGCFAAIARSNTFFLISMVIVLTNSVWIGVEADAPHRTNMAALNAEQTAIEHLFCLVFTLEIVIRFCAFRRKRDCLKDFWFGFDGALVVLMIGEVWMLPLVMLIAGVDSSDVHAVKELTILRTVRLLRLTRLGRIARLLRAVPEVVTLLKGIAAAIRSVFFTLLLLLVLLFVFGVVFKTQAKEDFESLQDLFPTVPATMWVLLLSGTFLDSPSVALNEVGATSGWLVALFLIFIFLSHMMVLNMLIGILCDVVHQVALNEKEEAAVAYLKNTLLEILECHDKDNDRQIHRDEFELLMRNPEMHFVLTRFGVNVSDLINLKDVLFEDTTEQDDDDDYEDESPSPNPSRTPRCRRLRKLSFQEFLEVVLRLRGGNSASVMDIVDLREYVRQRFDRMDLRMHQCTFGGSPIPFSKLRTMKSMPTRGALSRHMHVEVPPEQSKEDPQAPRELPRLLAKEPGSPSKPSEKTVSIDEVKSPRAEAQEKDSPSKLPKACLRKSGQSGLPSMVTPSSASHQDPFMAKLEEISDMQQQLSRRQGAMHADLLHKHAELSEQVLAVQGQLAQIMSWFAARPSGEGASSSWAPGDLR